MLLSAEQPSKLLDEPARLTRYGRAHARRARGAQSPTARAATARRRAAHRLAPRQLAAQRKLELGARGVTLFVRLRRPPCLQG